VQQFRIRTKKIQIFCPTLTSTIAAHGGKTKYDYFLYRFQRITKKPKKLARQMHYSDQVSAFPCWWLTGCSIPLLQALMELTLPFSIDG